MVSSWVCVSCLHLSMSEAYSRAVEQSLSFLKFSFIHTDVIESRRSKPRSPREESSSLNWINLLSWFNHSLSQRCKRIQNHSLFPWAMVKGDVESLNADHLAFVWFLLISLTALMKIWTRFAVDIHWQDIFRDFFYKYILVLTSERNVTDAFPS